MGGSLGPGSPLAFLLLPLYGLHLCKLHYLLAALWSISFLPPILLQRHLLLEAPFASVSWKMGSRKGLCKLGQEDMVSTWVSDPSLLSGQSLT